MPEDKKYMIEWHDNTNLKHREYFADSASAAKYSMKLIMEGVDRSDIVFNKVKQTD